MRKTITKNELNWGHRTFRKVEGRHSIYDLSRGLISKGMATEGRLLLLAGWNGAWFSKVGREFKVDDLTMTMDSCEPIFRGIGNYSLETAPLQSIKLDITKLYQTLSSQKAIKYTGATKLMSLELPALFVMWDSEIRKEYGVKNTGPDQYLSFLLLMQNCTKTVNWDPTKNNNTQLAKAIDEFNYVRFTLGMCP